MLNNIQIFDKRSNIQLFGTALVYRYSFCKPLQFSQTVKNVKWHKQSIVIVGKPHWKEQKTVILHNQDHLLNTWAKFHGACKHRFCAYGHSQPQVLCMKNLQNLLDSIVECRNTEQLAISNIVLGS